MKSKTKKSLISNGIFAVAIILLFVTGAHTEVFGFVQRGLLQTGLMDPNVEEAIEAIESPKIEVIPETTETPETGKKAETPETVTLAKADFNLLMKDINGNRVSMEQFRGKVIFLNLWATWCPPCIAEMPGIHELYKDVKGDNVEFIMLSLDQSFDKAKEFRKKKEYGFNIYHPAAPLPAMYNSGAIPTTYIIDTEGNLAMTHQGMGDFDTKEFREFLKKLQE